MRHVLAITVLLAATRAGADAPPKLKVTGVQVGGRSTGEPDAALGDQLIVSLAPGDGDRVAELRKDAPQKFGLFLDGEFLKGVPAQPAGTNPDAFRFTLERTEENKANWAYLLGWRHGAWAKHVNVTVGMENGATAVSNQTIHLRVFPGLKAWILAPALALLLGAFAWLGWRTGALRDVGAVPPGQKAWYGAFSLGRTQMAWWTVVIAFAFVFLWAATGSVGPLSPSLLTLMGISAATGLAAVIIDDTKRSTATGEIAELTAQKATLEQTAAELAKDATKADQLKQAQAQLAEVTKKLDALVEKKAVDVAPSQGFIRDVMTDVHRFQMVVWTLVVTIYFFGTVVTRMVMPELDPSLFVLMGISSGAYLGFKLPEKS